MKAKLIILSLIAAMLLFGLVSCGTEEDGFESVLTDSDTVTSEITDDENIQSGDTKRTNYPANVQLWPTISTGQTSCYGVDGKIPCPHLGEQFYGQDATYQMTVRSFIDNSDGSVTDGETSMVWQKGYKADLTWYEAQSYCENLTLASSEWRLPTTHELKTLVNYDLSDPAIDTTAFPNTPSEWFWATKHSGFNDVASGLEASWIINFLDGFVEYTSRFNLYNVRCIRAN
ncbi:MAG TPA: DUF1566 domain-containing protein [bacterium]|nr:DUF1566 domain-containing protein [bacterium]